MQHRSMELNVVFLSLLLTEMIKYNGLTSGPNEPTALLTAIETKYENFNNTANV